MRIFEGYFNDKNNDDSIVTDIELTSVTNKDSITVRLSTNLYKDYPKTLEEFLKKLKYSWHRLMGIFNILYNVEEVISYTFMTYDSNTEDFVEVDFRDNNCSVLFENPEVINNSKQLFADFNLMLNEPFDMKTIDLLCKRIFTLPNDKSSIKPYIFTLISVNGKTIKFGEYDYKYEKQILFFPNMIRFASGIIPINEHPILKVVEYYKMSLSSLMKHYMESIASRIKHISTVPLNLNYNQVYLFNSYSIEHNYDQDSKYGWCSLSLDSEEQRDKTDCDLFCKMTETDIEDICKKAAKYVILNCDDVDLMLLNRYQCMSDRPTGLCYIFNKTFVYNDEEYIVVLMLGYETEVALYKISNDKADIIINTLINDFNIPKQLATTWLEDEEIIFQK